MSGSPQQFTGVITVSSGTAAEWAATTKEPPQGVLMFESDTLKFKVADGVTLYSALDYVINTLASMAIGEGLQNDGSGNLTIKIADGSIVLSSAGASVDSVAVINPTASHGSLASGTLNLNRAQAAAHSATVTGPITIQLSNFPTGSYADVSLELTNGGSAAVTFPNNINWVTGTGATTTSFATYGEALQSAGTDNIAFWSYDGVNFFGKVVR